ncbi:PREDICTED: P-selectin-like [Branchiostoma belcheri]|uniref:P-selectin-like n=1 Tax=Branchiostoma belcheri TaxID=7741 RepID=A0A6P5A5C6_BRABE|nr:PREDICTED: P-selectin-like [Branchiostoma belcheri]
MTTTLQCSELTPPAKGSMMTDSYRGEVYFGCDPGYKLVGDSPLTCQSDGTWSGRSPTCMKAAVCPMIRPPANVRYNGSAQVLSFFCEEGYTLVGASLLTCRSDGTWTGNPPTCRAKCPYGYQLLAQTCIKVSFYETKYAKALAACEKDGATLAMPKTKELDVALRNLIRKVGGSQDYWIGLVKCDGTWKWLDGSPLENYKVR